MTDDGQAQNSLHANTEIAAIARVKWGGGERHGS